MGAISQSTNPRRYWSDLKRDLTEKGYNELYEDIVQLPMQGKDGKLYQTDAATAETLFRITQSIRSPNAEPAKRWLAKVGYERILETQNPELARNTGSLPTSFRSAKESHYRHSYRKSWPIMPPVHRVESLEGYCRPGEEWMRRLR